MYRPYEEAEINTGLVLALLIAFLLGVWIG